MHELLHVAAAAVFVVAGVSALLEYRTLRERVVLTYGAMCLCAAAYAAHVVISHNLPKLGAFWMPWTSAGLIVTFGAGLFYLLTMRTFVGASSRLLSAAIAIQTALMLVVVCDLLFYAATGSSLLFLPVHRGFGGRLRHLISGGAALSRDTLRTFRGLGFDLNEGYGLTEAAPVLTVTRPGDRASAGSVARDAV